MTKTSTHNPPLADKLAPPLLPQDDRLRDLWCLDAADCQKGDRQIGDSDTAQTDLIAAIIYAAPHLHHALKRNAAHYPDDCQHALAGDIPPIVSQAEGDLTKRLREASDDESVMKAVRQYRYRCYLALALAELAGSISVETQMKHLSQCAEFALQEALLHLTERAGISPQAMVILGMGKLGAHELNYSSDIDLIILYDASYEGASSADYVKISRALIQILQKQTADGFGWRVDLRLRPDPGATAIALSTDAAISYYESIARSWERAVFIRARPVAGNLALGKSFLEAISPFIWRRQLDYSILTDLTAWVTHYPMSQQALAFDVKRGAFAIRHIEMMTHLLQLLHGGRDPQLRSCQTDKALAALAQAGHLTSAQATQSIALYWQWRALEHRLQYCRDAHIYQTPNNRDDFTQFARFAGFEDATSLYQHLTTLQSATKESASHPIIGDMIAAHEGALRRGAWPADEGAQQVFLAEKGFQRPDDILRTIESWMSGRLPATRSERARQELQSLLPIVLTELAKGSDIDAHFMGFAQFLEALPAGVQVFTLLNQHPQLIELISDFTLSAPSLMRTLTKSPHIFEQMLDESFFAPLSVHSDFDQWLANEMKGKPAELQLDAIRLVAREAKFRAEAHIITYPAAAEEAHEYLSALSDACLSACFAITITEFEAQHGTIKGGDFAVLLLGRAGQRRLTPQSDIDVIFLYDGDKAVMSDGPKQLSLTHYYTRLAQRLLSWTSAQTASGSLYEIDARLRPDGNAGPLATYFPGWQEYLAEKAWPFERLALHKARLLAQPITSPAFAHKIDDLIATMLSAPIERGALVGDINLLRQKLRAQKHEEWDFKKRAGGLLDCEFLTHLTKKSPDEAIALFNHLSLMSAVMMPRQAGADTEPASFKKELCRVMQQSSFEKACGALEAEFATIAAQLDEALAL